MHNNQNSKFQLCHISKSTDELYTKDTSFDITDRETFCAYSRVPNITGVQNKSVRGNIFLKMIKQEGFSPSEIRGFRKEDNDEYTSKT